MKTTQLTRAADNPDWEGYTAQKQKERHRYGISESPMSEAEGKKTLR
jgi:hypothetical protein